MSLAIHPESLHANKFLQADDQAMPSRIEAKVQSRPPQWNTWSGSITRVSGVLALPPPDFLPGPSTASMVTLSHPADGPRATTFSLASRPAPKRTASQTSDSEEQGNKKPKVEA